MEARALGRIFRRLFSHETCSSLRFAPENLNPLTSHNGGSQARTASSWRPGQGSQWAKDADFWQRRSNYFPPEKMGEYGKYPMVTAEDLKERKERPRRVKMLTRDFIEDSLYNPNYGYFPKHVTIFNSGDPFDFNGMRDEDEFYVTLGRRYTEFEDLLDEREPYGEPNDVRQLWHTPTELFRPYYGEAIARCLVESYLPSHFPSHDLVIYEIGAGNGTLTLNILDHMRVAYPEVYERTRFRIVEISPQLAAQQRTTLTATAASRGHADRVEIIEGSIFDWNEFVPEPCWFVALEVVDNFAHDTICYDPVTQQPHQGVVLIDGNNEFYELYQPQVDPLAESFLYARAAACEYWPVNHPLGGSPTMRRLRSYLPGAPNLTLPEYIPTRLLQFFENLNRCFPLHRLLLSDFNELPGPVRGYNGPAVQTRYRRRPVPVTTPLVHQGYFDIIFPTDFEMATALYQVVTGKFASTMLQENFLRQWATVEDTRTRNGENPMLSWYKNASVMITV